MLRLSELIPALRLAHAVGERPFGHYDHDANAASGPNSVEPYAGSLHHSARSIGRPTFERFRDEQTGELLIRRL